MFMLLFCFCLKNLIPKRDGGGNEVSDLIKCKSCDHSFVSSADLKTCNRYFQFYDSIHFWL